MFSQICSNCQNKDSIIDDYESGETVCTCCGNILGEHLISDEYEERFFEGEENEVQRIGLPEKPETINDPSITLVIRSKGEKRIYKEYSKKDKISKNSLKIEKFCSKVDIIPAIVSRIKYLYKKLAPRQNMQGRNFNHIIIALYYHALRQLGQAKSMKEVSKMFYNVTERQIKKVYKKIKLDIPDKIDDDNYAFPTPVQILSADADKLAGCGLGYRLPYIRLAAEVFYSEPAILKRLDKLSDEELLEELKKMQGVGDKVASCIALFGFHRLNFFPKDVWINRALDEHFPNGFNFTAYAPYNGVIQQYIFYAYRNANR